MRNVTACWAIAAALVSGVPSIANAASDLPAIVSARIAEDVKLCDTHDAKLEKGFVRRQDVNGDGKDDIILDYGHYVCGGSHSFFCGSGGCTTVVFVSHGAGYVKALDDLVQGYKFTTIKGRPALVLGLHGSACGKAGAAPCGETLYWNGEKFSPAH